LEINGLSVTSAAKKIGVPQPRLNDIVLGRTKSPQTKTLQKIAQGFNVLIGWLVSGDGEMREVAYSIPPEKSVGVMEPDRGGGYLLSRAPPSYLSEEARTQTERRLIRMFWAASEHTRNEIMLLLERESKPEGNSKNGTEG
jgi:transcriptional regulator with XRE-family HTH domain